MSDVSFSHLTPFCPFSENGTCKSQESHEVPDRRGVRARSTSVPTDLQVTSLDVSDFPTCHMSAT